MNLTRQSVSNPQEPTPKVQHESAGAESRFLSSWELRSSADGTGSIGANRPSGSPVQKELSPRNRA